MTGTNGILLIALGGVSYAKWAANMAASLRFHSPDVKIHLAHSEGFETNFTEVEKLKLFDSFSVIPKEYYTNEKGKFAPGKCKLYMNLYTPFNRTIYIDVDGCAIKDIKPIFESLKDRAVVSQVVSTTETGAESWACQWMSLKDTLKTYNIKGKFRLEELNSSFMYFDKDKNKCKDYFEAAQRCYIDDYVSTWGGSFPDELAFNVATQLSGLSLAWEKPITFFENPTNQYFVGLYGGYSSKFLRIYRIYEREINKAWIRIMGKTAPYKFHHLMKRKFIIENRNLVKV
jgi:hypothetical protein